MLKCNKCGNIFGATKDRVMKLIEKHGTIEAVQANYECRNCRPKKSNIKAQVDELIKNGVLKTENGKLVANS